MGFLDGGVASAFSGMFSGFYFDGLLFRPETFSDDGAGGGENGTFLEGEDIKFQPEKTTQDMRNREGYVETDKRYLILAYNVDQLDTDCEIEAEDQRWSIFHWDKDPAGAYYDTHCQLLGEPDASS